MRDLSGVHGVGFGMRQAAWDEPKGGDRVVEWISPRLMKVRLQFGKPSRVSSVSKYAPTEKSGVHCLRPVLESSRHRHPGRALQPPPCGDSGRQCSDRVEGEMGVVVRRCLVRTEAIT